VLCLGVTATLELSTTILHIHETVSNLKGNFRASGERFRCDVEFGGRRIEVEARERILIAGNLS